MPKLNDEHEWFGFSFFAWFVFNNKKVVCLVWKLESNLLWELLDIRWEKAMAPHSSTLAWKIPWMEEPGGLPSMGSHRVGHDWSDLAAVAADITWSVKTQVGCDWFSVFIQIGERNFFSLWSLQSAVLLSYWSLLLLMMLLNSSI